MGALWATTNFALSPNSDQHQFCPNDIHTSSKEKVMKITPFAVHYKKICIHLRETVTKSAEIHSLERKKGTLAHKSDLIKIFA